MVLVPFIPNPYEDEILGSWLARVKLLNGNGAWRSLLEAAGFGRRVEVSLFNLVDFDDRLEKLLTLLGLSYERAMLTMTTLPYWLAFSANGTSHILDGTKSVPVPLSARGENVSSVRLLGTRRQLGEAEEVRYCPECILEDVEIVGEVYFHRSHQLPNVHFCHKHHCELRLRCHACGASPLRRAKQLMIVPSIACECGTPRHKRMPSRRAEHIQRRLVQVSTKALQMSMPTWDRSNVLAYFRTKLCEGADTSRGRYQILLINSFASFNFSHQPNIRLDRSSWAPDEKLHFRKYLSQATAPEYCGLIVALNIDLPEAVAGFIANSVAAISCSPTSKPKPTMSIGNSRQALLQPSQKRGPPSIKRRHYWFLRLNDGDWLREHFPATSVDQIPSKEADRLDIESRMSATEGGRPFLNRSPTNSPARIRAGLRDKVWLDALLAFARGDDRSIIRQQSRDTKRAAQIAVLELALTSVLEKEDKPSRIFASTLGAIAGLSDVQTGELIRSHPPLRASIDAANNDKIRRQLIWAARQVYAGGGRLSKRQIGKRAGLPTAHVTNEVFHEICNMISGS